MSLKSGVFSNKTYLYDFDSDVERDVIVKYYYSAAQEETYIDEGFDDNVEVEEVIDVASGEDIIDSLTHNQLKELEERSYSDHLEKYGYDPDPNDYRESTSE